MKDDRHRVGLEILAGLFMILLTMNYSTASAGSDSQPEKLVIDVGAAVGPRFKVELVGDEIVYRSGHYGPDGKLVEEHVRPTPKQWAEFWRVMEEVQLEKWSESYICPYVMCGYQWSVHIEKDGRIFESRGSNSYPSDEDPSKGTHSESTGKAPSRILKQSRLFQRFLGAVSALVGNLPFN